MSHLLRSVAVAALLAASLAAPPDAVAAPPAASPSQQAHQHFRSGVQLFGEGDHAAALVEFQRAYDIDPKFQVLYNIAQSHYQLQDYASALQTYQRYLDEGGAKIGFRRRKDVEAEIATLSRRVATLTITTSEPGASITIDDRAVGTTPLDPLLVSSGRRKVTATLPGRPPATAVVDLAGGDKKAVELDIAAIPPPVVITERVPTTEAPAGAEPPSPLPAVVMWSVTGALATGALITGVVALGASSDVEEELARFPGDPDALDSASSSASGFGLATDILLGATLVSAAVATYFTIDLMTAPEQEASPEPAARVVVRPGGVAVDGTF